MYTIRYNNPETKKNCEITLSKLNSEARPHAKKLIKLGMKKVNMVNGKGTPIPIK